MDVGPISLAHLALHARLAPSGSMSAPDGTATCPRHHVNTARVLCIINSLFAIILFLENAKRNLEKSRKIVYLKKFITSFLELFFASNFLH